jgi:hypothetical protein
MKPKGKGIIKIASTGVVQGGEMEAKCGAGLRD